MSDFLDVLNISKQQYEDARASKASADAVKKQSLQNSASYTPYTADEYASNNKRRKISAMNRELYNLIGPNAPPVALVAGGSNDTSKSTAVNKFKRKLDVKRKPWIKTGFINQARDDGLVLFHWSKTDLDTATATPEPVIRSGEKETENKNENEIENKNEHEHEKEKEMEKEKEKGKEEQEDPEALDQIRTSENDGKIIMDEKIYKFAKYNTSFEIPSFTEIEYEEIKSTLPLFEKPWTFEETNEVFELCKLYDMNWFVIFDRYLDKYHETARDIGDLKSQMYSVSHSILTKRGSKDTLLLSALSSFSAVKERERKEYLNRLIHRAPTEIAEEESLVLEARKFELAAKKMLMDRAMLLQLLDSPQSSASIQQYTTSAGLTQLYMALMNDKTRKRKPEAPVAPQLGPNAIPHTQQVTAALAAMKKKSSKGNYLNPSDPIQLKMNELQELLAVHLTPEELSVYGIEIHTVNRLQPGVHMRSQKTASFKPSVQNKVTEILNQLGLTEKPNMPTAAVVQRWDELANTIARVVETKKQTDKLKTEVELIKRQKGLP